MSDGGRNQNFRIDEANRKSSHLRRMGVDWEDCDYVVALVGNPNTGKSTVFNDLTGLRQHTGNWPGKTVVRAMGAYESESKVYKVIDLPGTYSLLAVSEDEEIARDFILFGKPDVTVIVLDATCLERNLNLALQVLEITEDVVIALNLVDEAHRHNIEIDHNKLSEILGVPVVPTVARYNKGIGDLILSIHKVATGQRICKPYRIQQQSLELQKAVDLLAKDLVSTYPQLPNIRWLAARFLDGDKRIIQAFQDGEFNKLSEANLKKERKMNSVPNKQPEDPSKKSIDEILDMVDELRWSIGENIHERIVEETYQSAAKIADQVVTRISDKEEDGFDIKLDQIVTSPVTGTPIMVLLLVLVFWITIKGANYPSSLLYDLLIGKIHPLLKMFSRSMGLPWLLGGFLIDGVYLATAWVISVMLPPMAIFFPLFTLLEDFGYLPRVAFNLDWIFKKTGAHGKQALSMVMGFGCNAAGVVATRIIDSPRERLIAILTNNFSLCNGRWPTQVLLASIFLAPLAPKHLQGLVATGAVVGIALLGVFLTFGINWVLSHTLLRGEASTFSLELPPYRPPRILQTIYTSLIDRTLIILWRAIVFAAPAGAVIWLVSNIHINNTSIAEHFIQFANPFGELIGLNGVILLAFFVAIPANEIVIPTVLMLTVLSTGVISVGAGAGVLFELDSIAATKDILISGGWTVLTAINVMIFSLIHNPCSTTIYTIYRETASIKWTLVATFLPLFMGIIATFVAAQVFRLSSAIF